MVTFPKDAAVICATEKLPVLPSMLPPMARTPTRPVMVSAPVSTLRPARREPPIFTKAGLPMMRTLPLKPPTPPSSEPRISSLLILPPRATVNSVLMETVVPMILPSMRPAVRLSIDSGLPAG